MGRSRVKTKQFAFAKELWWQRLVTPQICSLIWRITTKSLQWAKAVIKFSIFVVLSKGKTYPWILCIIHPWCVIRPPPSLVKSYVGGYFYIYIYIQYLPTLYQGTAYNDSSMTGLFQMVWTYVIPSVYTPCAHLNDLWTNTCDYCMDIIDSFTSL